LALLTVERDLGDIDFINSSGLGALVGCLKEARATGSDLRILCPGAQAAMMLQLSMVDQLLVTAESAETPTTPDT